MSSSAFLPVRGSEIEEKGIKQLDFILVTGDAYCDHPSFGAAIIARVLESQGYSTGIIAQPDWKLKESFKILGKPRLAFLVTSGNIDSMVNNYSVTRHKRNKDIYSPGEKPGKRPDRAVIVYCNRIRDAYGDVPIIIGGLEASLRRLAHYDYWEDRVRRSILLDSKADMVVYGMGEKQIVAVADCLSGGLPVSQITFIPGTVYRTKQVDDLDELIKLPTYAEVSSDKVKYAESFMLQYENSSPFCAQKLAEKYDDSTWVVQNVPAEPLTREEMDEVYSLPYTRIAHPMYETMGGIKALEEVSCSITSSRGCFGGCSFCALTFHQGRMVSSRSHASIISEARELVATEDFKGYIHDVGGPTANFRHPSCRKQLTEGVCKKKQCLFPEPCKMLDTDQSEYTDLLIKLRNIKGISKVFIRSGIRYDYLMLDKDKSFLEELCSHHVSGQLKIAPEHVSPGVLRYMSKPQINVYEKFAREFEATNKKLGKEQYLVSYFISSHPGSTLKDAIELAVYLKEHKIRTEQVQDFYPTPGTLSTCMYYTGLDPRTMEPVYSAVSARDKALQRALLQYDKPENHERVREALTLAGRQDLIGFGRECIVKPGRQTEKRKYR